MTDDQNIVESPAAKLFERLRSSRNSLRRENASNVKAICDNMERDNVPITPSEVARRCIDLFGGPAPSTITNTNSQLGEYVRLRRLEQKSNVKGDKRVRPPLSGMVSDHVLASEIQILEEANRMLTLENHALRNLYKKITGFDIDKELRKAGRDKEVPTIGGHSESSLHIDQALQAVLLKLMDHLIAERQYESYRGRFVVNKKMVLSPPEYTLYRKAVGLTDEEWIKRYGEF